MNDIRAELHDALDQEAFPGASLLDRAMAGIERPARRRPYVWAPPLAAGIVAAALIVTLVMVRFNGLVLAPADNMPLMPSGLVAKDIVSYHFVSPQVGWAEIYTGSTIIARTSDGGRTWHKLLELPNVSPERTLQAVDASDAAVFAEQGDPTPTVWVTSDAGEHWRSSRPPVTPEQARAAQPGAWVISSGFFLNGHEGWIVLAADYFACGGCGLIHPPPALVLHTSDGGAEWTQLSSFQTGNGLSIYFASPSLGFAVPGSGVPLYRTADGGRTWVNVIPLPGPECGKPPCSHEALDLPTFFSPLVGVTATTFAPAPACGNLARTPAGACTFPPQSRYLYSTRDGGLTWSAENQLPGTGQLIFVSPAQAVDVSADGLTETTPFGGWTSATSIPIPSGWFVSTAQFQDLSHGWVALSDYPNGAQIMASGGTTGLASPQFQLLGTSDGGRTWEHVSLPRI